MPRLEPDIYRGFELALHDPGIALITFNQPERLNGMTQDMKRDLVEVLVMSQMDESVRVVVFTGTGRAFSAGDDISGKPRDSAGARALVPRVPAGHDTPICVHLWLKMVAAVTAPASRRSPAPEAGRRSASSSGRSLSTSAARP